MNEIPIRVLLVDDEEEYASILSERLARRGIEIVTAARGDEALALLEEKNFDTALVDVMMPRMSGLELLRQIKRLHPRVEVILFTGHGSTRDGVAGMRLGAFDYLDKLEDIESLVAKIRAAAEKGMSGGA
jgi:DNA-binding response OmpR family regulator